MTTDYFSLSEKEREDAIKYLTDTIPDKEWSEVLAFMQREGESWTALAHFCFGMRVRNLLYEGPVTLQTANLDYEWAALVEEVIKRKFDYGFGREKGSFRKFTKPRPKD